MEKIYLNVECLSFRKVHKILKSVKCIKRIEDVKEGEYILSLKKHSYSESAKGEIRRAFEKAEVPYYYYMLFMESEYYG